MTRVKVEWGRQGRAVKRVEQAPREVATAIPSRAARQLALAYWVERRIEAGELRDLAHAAAVLGVTRARMTQIANLRLLPVGVQEEVLVAGTVCCERQLRQYETSRVQAPSSNSIPIPRSDGDQSDPTLAASAIRT